MKLTRFIVLLCVFGCLANDSAENKGVTRFYLFGDPIGYLPGRTGVQDLKFRHTSLERGNVQLPEATLDFRVENISLVFR